MKYVRLAAVVLVACAVEQGLSGDAYDYKDLVVRDVRPVTVRVNKAGNKVADFGFHAAGYLELTGPATGAYEVVIGELTDARGSVTNAYRHSSIRCIRVKGVKKDFTHRVPLPGGNINLRGYDPKMPAVRLPAHIGIIMPFRYVEIVKAPPVELVQKAVNYPIPMDKSSFDCDNGDLVRVYEFCRYSILATSFCGMYVDGDRERTPYEADAYINQLCHYAMDDDYSLARKTHEHLMLYPTWPTEWRQHSIMMAWADWMWTGDTRSIAKFYPRLKDEKLMRRYERASDGLLETGGEHRKTAKPGAGDIVDWPPVERDGFEFKGVNAVVNAFYFLNLRQMADIAAALGRDADAAMFKDRARSVYEAYQKTFYNASTGLYVDGEGSRHSSLHANAAALAFGLVPPGRRAAVLGFLEKKGMACSVYFAQYLLEAFCEAGRADIAVRLMSSKGPRSWVGMMDFGTTVAMEAWNVRVKPNLDLNHAWGACPLNIISRYILGVTPARPGFEKINIRPLAGGLSRMKGVVPTAAGPVKVEVADGVLHVETPRPAQVVFGGRNVSVGPGRHVIKPSASGGN